MYLICKPRFLVLHCLCICCCHFITFVSVSVELAEISSEFVIFEGYILLFQVLQDLAKISSRGLYSGK